MTQLATRCSQCGTSFRVSEAQLAVSDGYVRCGRCDAVFNARQALFDLEGDRLSGPMPLEPMTEPEAPPAAVATPPAVPPEPALDSDEPEWESTAAWPATESPDPEPGFATPAEADVEPRWEHESMAARPGVGASLDGDVRRSASEQGADPNAALRSLLGVEAASAPAGDAQSESPSPWASLESKSNTSRAARSSWALAVGGIAAALLALALPLQWGWIEREHFRARSPQVDQWLRTHWPSLPSQGLRQLDSVSVAGSSLLATPQGGAYQLDLTVQNRAAHAVAAPWLDLRLSDSQGRPLVRKALTPTTLGSDRPLQPHEERRLQVVFRLKGAGPAVSGYELGLFHP